jgi:hypothetical protein
MFNDTLDTMEPQVAGTPLLSWAQRRHVDSGEVKFWQAPSLALHVCNTLSECNFGRRLQLESIIVKVLVVDSLI